MNAPPRRFAPLLAAASLLASPLAAAATAGCSSGPECVIDTDCALGLRCASDQTCQPIGASRDAGGPGADAGARDGAVADAGRDAGGAIDAGSDAGAACPALAPGLFRVSVASPECAGIGVDAQVSVRESEDADPCAWIVESPGTPTADGTMTIDSASMVAASLRLAGATDATDCTGLYTAMGGTVAFMCGTCGFVIAPMP